jgi:hypothetical protein
MRTYYIVCLVIKNNKFGGQTTTYSQKFIDVDGKPTQKSINQICEIVATEEETIRNHVCILSMIELFG